MGSFGESLSFGVLVTAVGDGGGGDEVDLLELARARLGGKAGGRPLFVGIGDFEGDGCGRKLLKKINNK